MSSGPTNEFEPTEDYAAIRAGVRSVVTRFGDDYWLARDDDGEFPRDFHRAMADAGWLGITMPEEYGGSGLGVTEAAIMMHEVASHGGGMSAASAVHINLFGPHPIVVKGTPEQRLQAMTTQQRQQILVALIGFLPMRDQTGQVGTMFDEPVRAAGEFR